MIRRVAAEFWRPRRRYGWIAVLLAAATVLGAAELWEASGTVERRAFRDNSPRPLNLVVRDVGHDWIDLHAELQGARWRAPGVWGLEWEDGRAQVGRILEQRPESVRRQRDPLDPRPPVGVRARLDDAYFVGDPLSAHGQLFDEVLIPGPAGPLPAWATEGSDRWAILLHGRGADRQEMLRILPVFWGTGASTLTVSYRGHSGAPPTDSFQWGATEWRDVEAAFRWAEEQGATEVVLVGYSMGGAAALAFLYNSPLADRVSAVVLDSPALDLQAIVRQNAGVPRPFIDTAMWLAARRFGIDWSAYDWIRDADRLAVPVLVLHGGGDERVPLSVSQRLRDARPDLVHLRVVEGAPHVGAWNADPGVYEGEVMVRLADTLMAPGAEDMRIMLETMECWNENPQAFEAWTEGAPQAQALMMESALGEIRAVRDAACGR